MVKLSFFAASAIIALVSGQIQSQTAIPSEPALSPPEPGCGGCYVIADVAGIVFGGVATQTITQVTNIGTGPNGTALTTQVTTASATLSTQVTQDMFSFSPGGLIDPSAVSTRYDLLDSTIVVSGATLTSPTQYEVFTAFSVTSFSADENGVCRTVAGERMEVSPAIEVAVPDDAMGDFLTQAEMQFIQSLALTCAPGGGNVASTVQTMVTQETTQSMTMGIIRPTPIAVSTAADTPSPTSNATVPMLPTANPNPPSFTTISPPIMPGAGASIAPGIFGLGAAFGIGLAAMLF